MIKKFSHEIEYCTFCPKMCRFACPACEATGDEARTPTFRASVLYRILHRKDVPPEMRTTIYSCVLCRGCRVVCAHEIDVPQYTVYGRALLNEDGLADIGSKKIFERFESWGNPYELRFRVSPLKDTVFFPGCKLIKFYPETFVHTEELLRFAGIKFSVMERCCGFPLYSMGYVKEFENHLKNLKRELKGAKRIITVCPACRWVIKEFLGFGSVMDGISAVMMEKPPIKKRHIGKFYYHDPCYRVRFFDESEEIRELLSYIVEGPVEEFVFSRNNTFCCGGGVMEFVDPEMVRSITKMRASEMKPGYSVITSCPGCRKNFESIKVEVKDLLEMIYESVIKGEV